MVRHQHCRMCLVCIILLYCTGVTYRPVTLFLKVINTEVMTDIPTWFCDSKLNYAENLLKFNDNRTAIITSGIVHFVSSQLIDVALRQVKTRIVP